MRLHGTQAGYYKVKGGDEITLSFVFWWGLGGGIVPPHQHHQALVLLPCFYFVYFISCCVFPFPALPEMASVVGGAPTRPHLPRSTQTTLTTDVVLLHLGSMSMLVLCRNARCSQTRIAMSASKSTETFFALCCRYWSPIATNSLPSEGGFASRTTASRRTMAATEED